MYKRQAKAIGTQHLVGPALGDEGADLLGVVLHVVGRGDDRASAGPQLLRNKGDLRLVGRVQQVVALGGLTVGTEEQIIKGMYLCKPGAEGQTRVQLLGSGSILRESLAAQTLLAADWGIQADVWSCPSFNELARDGQAAERHNLLHPTDKPQVSFVEQQLVKSTGPVIASTDYMKNYAEQIRPFMPKGRSYKVLGTDGFGRSDFRSKLREHFEINRHYIVIAALKSLADEGALPATKVAEAIKKYGIKTEKINPLYA